MNMEAIASALHKPDAIASMFIDNGDGTFTVRYYRTLGHAEYVTVDRCLPTTTAGELTFASQGAYYGAASNELWVALAEKAYVQLNESGWMDHGNQNAYQAIAGGFGGPAMSRISGRHAT